MLSHLGYLVCFEGYETHHGPKDPGWGVTATRGLLACIVELANGDQTDSAARDGDEHRADDCRSLTG